MERQRKNLVGRLGLLEDEGDAAVVAEALKGLAVERRQVEGERVQVLARRAAWEAHRQAGERMAAWFAELQQEVAGLGYAEKRLALEALGVHVTVGRASDTPRYVIRMELGGPAVVDGQSIHGVNGQRSAPGPLVLRWTDADELEGLAAD